MTTRTDTESELVRRWIESSPRRARPFGATTAASETGSFDWDELLETAERSRSTLVAELGAVVEAATAPAPAGAEIPAVEDRSLAPPRSNVAAAMRRSRRIR